MPAKKLAFFHPYSSIHQQTQYYCLWLAMFSLPISRALLSISLAVLALNWLAEGKWAEKWDRLRAAPFQMLIPGFFLLYLLGMLYTQNFSQGISNLQIKLPFLFIPIILGSSQPLEKHRFRQLLYAFISGCLLAVATSFSLALWDHFQAGFSWADIAGSASLTYEELAGQIGSHPTYFSLFLNLALICLVWLWYNRSNGKSNIIIVTLSVLMLIFFLFQFMLSAKMQLLALLILGLAGISLILIRKKALMRKGIFILSALLLVMGSTSMLNPHNQQRLQALWQNEDENNYYWNSKTVRLHIWDAAVSTFSEKTVFGWGTGDGYPALQNSFRENAFTYGSKNQFNAHNQYLETGLSLGGIGVLYLLLLLGLPMAELIRRKQYIFAAILILFMLSFLTESILTRQLGVSSFVLFISLWAAHSPPIMKYTGAS